MQGVLGQKKRWRRYCSCICHEGM